MKPTLQTLPNGLKLVVVPTTLSPTVVLRGQVGHNPGVQDPPGKEGIDDILDGLFSYGTTTYDRLAFQAELDKIAANVSAGSSFSLDALSKNFDRALDLLADDELRPRLPADAFEIVKKQTVGELAGEIDSPDYKARRALANALYPAGDPSRRAATPQSAGTVTLDDVKSYYAQTYRPDLTTIVVVGDVTPQRARASIERAFGGWKAQGPAPNVFPPAVPPNKPGSASVPATGRIQSEVTLAQTMPLTYRDADYPIVLLANTVLSGGFYASLLYHDVREVHGYAYTVDSSVSPGRNRSVFTVTYGSDPKNVGNAERIIVDDLTSLQRKPLPASRLTNAKALVIGSLPLRKESYEGLAGQLLTYASQDRPLDADVISARAQLAATPATVQAAFAKWIRPRDFVRIVVGPAGK
ncbi:MAG: insulinase family protein [Candidatus Eremiobacteraeota bacterium]|nr:insulinase family protein [Candidatus Eremiobacteraeota bacterium]